MQSLLAEKFNGNQVKVSQKPGTPASQAIAAVDALLVAIPEKAPAAVWKCLPQGSKLQALVKRRKADSVPAVSSRISNKGQTAVHVGLADPDSETFEQLTFARKLVAAAMTEDVRSVAVWAPGFDNERQRAMTEALAAAVLAAAYRLPTFKSDAAASALKSLRFFGLAEKIDLKRLLAEAHGNNLARFLTALPANKLDAVEYARLLRQLGKQHGWQCRRYSVAELKKMGAGAFLAVAQGNEDDSASVVRLRYRPNRAGKTPALSLIGKGIIFDTGGTNLKPFNSMLDMHLDMGGSAAAVGALLALTELEVPFGIDCWLAITENRTGPMAYKSQDVVTAANGKTIQIIHTDAEGRMALADVLWFASRDKPKLMIDYATLTGACINAVTKRYSGVFTNRPDLHPVLKRCGRDSGERVWPFPLGKDFLEDLRSDTADIKQCAPESGGDHILAASFLNEFVPEDVSWVHIDLSACSRKGGLAHVPTNVTGFGVRFTTSLVLDQNVLEKSAPPNSRSRGRRRRSESP